MSTTMPSSFYFNEDDNGRDTTPEKLVKELASGDVLFELGAGWGFMPWRQAQVIPFRHYMPAKSSRVEAGMPVDQRDPAYFKAVLEHIRKLVYRTGR